MMEKLLANKIRVYNLKIQTSGFLGAITSNLYSLMVFSSIYDSTHFTPSDSNGLIYAAPATYGPKLKQKGAAYTQVFTVVNYILLCIFQQIC